MKGSQSDRNLLLGMMALQMEFITRDQLIDGMHAWILDKAKSLSEILVEQRALDPGDRQALEAVVERHISRHGGDPSESLSSFSKTEDMQNTLGPIDDPDILECIGRVSRARHEPVSDSDLSATLPHVSSGEPIAGRFKIIRLHEEGGIGSVFLAVDRELNRQVALKQLKDWTSTSEQDRLRFVQEAEITGNLEHPGVVPVYGKGEFHDRKPYYAMRFVRGRNLNSAILALYAAEKTTEDPGEWRLEYQTLLRRFLTVCETIAYAHDRGVIHRDLKPRNILLGPYGETLVVDWGMAKVLGRKDPGLTPEDMTVRPPSSSDLDPTLAGSHMGTPAFMSPEQARGDVDRVSFPADVYSLGATLYMLITGRAPFVGTDKLVMATMVRSGEFPSPRQIRPSISRALEAICLKAMALRPEDRYETPRALAVDLERWLADQPVSAYAEPAAARLTRWVRFHRQIVASAAVIMVLSIVGLSVANWRLALANGRAEKATKDRADQLGMTFAMSRQFVAVTGRELAKFPKAAQLRIELSAMLRGHSIQLNEMFPNDLNVQMELAKVYQLVAAVSRIMGRLEESKADYQNAMNWAKKLSQIPSHSREATELLVLCLLERGELHRMHGKSSTADEDFRRALAVLDTQADQASESFRLNKGSVLISIAETLVTRGRHAESRDVAAQAVKIFESIPVPGKQPSEPQRLAFCLAMALTDRAVAAKEIDDRASAHADIERAIDVINTIPDNHNHTANRQIQRAITLYHQGTLFLGDALNRAEASACFDSAIKDLEPLAKETEEYAVFRQQLGISHGGRARARLAEKQFDLARQDTQIARQLLEKLQSSATTNPNYLSDLGEIAMIEFEIWRAEGGKDTVRGGQLASEAIARFQKALDIDDARVADAERMRKLEKMLEQLSR